MKYKAILFDLDGVICNTDSYHYQAWKELADRLGIAFNETDNQRLRGVSRMESLDILLEGSSTQFHTDEKERLADEKNSAYVTMLGQMTPGDLDPEVMRTLTLLRESGIRMAIASSSKNAPLILERLGLNEYFEAVADGNQISKSKPDPEVFLLAAGKLNMSPDQCLIVEDAEAGAVAAERAGIDCAMIGAGAAGLMGEYQLSAFEQLLDIV